MKNRKLHGIVALSLFLLVFGCQSTDRQNSASSASPVWHEDRQEGVGVYLEKRGVMTEEDFHRLSAIQNRIYTKQSLTDADLEFCERLVRQPPLTQQGDNEKEVRRKVFQYLVGRKTLTPEQADRLYALTLEHMSDDDAMTREAAMWVHASLREERALGNIEKMAKSDPDAEVRQAAREDASRLEAFLRDGK
jgi:hypothetical protein